MIYFYNLRKKFDFGCQKKCVRQKLGFFKKSISQPFLNFLNSNFLKISHFLTYFDNLMRKMDVTYDNFSSQILTKSKPLKIWLSPRVRRCCLHDSQSSTEHILVVFAHFILKFSSNIIFMIYFYNLRKILIFDAKKSAYGKN